MTKILHIETGGTISGNVPEYKEIQRLSNIFMDSVDIDKHILYSLQLKSAYDKSGFAKKTLEK